MRRLWVDGVMRWIGAGLHLAVGFLYFASGLVAPYWAVVALWVVWLALAIVIVRLWQFRPRLVLAVPFIAYLIWLAVVLGGDVFLDWSA